jgi:hypothetical protein
MNSNKLTLTLGVFVPGIIFSSQAFAYLDPATGSILLQGLLAAIAGIAVTSRLYWGKIKSFFSRGNAADTASESKHDAIMEQRENEQ